MEEATVAIATADVMVYDDGSKRWLSPDGCVEPARSQVRILRNTRTNAFRIVGTRLQDREWILNCNVYERLKYNPATPTFHQWRDEKRKVYGLSFVTEEEAQLFVNVMTQAIAIISSNSEYQNGAEFGLSNGVYHEPQQLHHNAHSAPSFRDNDQDSICSSGVTSVNANTYRKSSHSVQSSSSGACLMLSSAQRRSSQGSSSSSNGSAAATTIYAASSTSTCTTNSPSRVAPPPASGASSAPLPPPTAASSGPPPAPPLPSGGIAAVSTNAPPAPPPPPPSSLTSAKPNCNSIAEQIKRIQLRKTNTALINNANTSQSRSENVAGARGRGDLFSELEATLNKRKNNAENIDSRPSGDSIVATTNGTIRRAWEKPSGGALNGSNSITDSPKTHRNIGRAPSGSSISSQEEPRTINGPIVSTSVTSNVSTASNVLTVEMLEQWKRDILNEVRAEINKAKNEIIDALQRR
uniref:Ribonuclease Oy n=1 Tax=Parascaris univalens TaxID=6257 RepID=A0A915APZ7_PARUN